MILVIDNYDSFVENLARYVRLCGAPTIIKRNNQISLTEIRDLNPTSIILSPGPCTPHESGICLDLIKEFKDKIPMLGICLGHQAIIEAFGGIVHKGDPCHGRQSLIHHDGSAIFQSIPQSAKVGRYHSLVCDIQNTSELIETARTNDGVNMAVQHRKYRIYGLQFHPESILTEYGMTYIQNFLNIARENAHDNDH